MHANRLHMQCKCNASAMHVQSGTCRGMTFQVSPNAASPVHSQARGVQQASSLRLMGATDHARLAVRSIARKPGTSPPPHGPNAAERPSLKQKDRRNDIQSSMEAFSGRAPCRGAMHIRAACTFAPSAGDARTGAPRLSMPDQCILRYRAQKDPES
jgi:hypothetical protein